MKHATRRRWAAVAVSVGLLVPAVPTAALAADGGGTPAATDDAPIHTYTATPGDTASDRYTLQANGTDVFVTKYANRSNNRMAVARFASDDRTPTLTVHNDQPVTSVQVYPARYYPASAVHVDGNDITFTLSDELPYAIVKVNGKDPGLAIIDDPTEKASDVPDPKASDVVNVGDYVTDLTGKTDQTDEITKAIDDLYSDDSKDTLYFPDGTYQYAGLELRNRTKKVTVYVAEGALLKNRIQPTMTAMEPAIGIWDSSNITIRGRGVFDGNGFANYDTANGGWRHDAATSQHQGGVMIVRSQHITFDDTLVRDAKQWNWETHTAKDVHLNNIKGLTPYAQPWVDGLDLASGQDITVDGALTLGNDDTFASGHYNPNSWYTDDPDRLTWDTEDTSGISVSNTLGWTAGAGSGGIKLGYAPSGHQLKDYTFDNLNSIGMGSGTYGVQFMGAAPYPQYQSITIKNSSFDNSSAGNLFSIKGDPSDLIGDVTLDNDWFAYNTPGSISDVDKLTIKDLTVGGTKVSRLTQTSLKLSDITTKDLDFAEDHAPQITAVDPQSVDFGTKLALTVATSDADGDTVKVTSDDLPDGATLDASTGAFAWTPTKDQLGDHTVDLVATDSRGATSTASFVVEVTDPDATVVKVTAGADTDVQTWSTEESMNYGDNEHVRMLSFGDSSLGALGEKYTGGQSGKDAKLTYLSFDLGDVADQLAAGTLEKAELRMTYLGPTKGALSGDDTLLVAKAAGGWAEGDGKSTPPTRTNTVDGGITWLTKPTVDASTVVESAPFDVTASGKVGADGTYTSSEKPVGTVAKTDVTSLVSGLGTDEKSLSLAVNESKKDDIVFVSREGAERNPNATGMAPQLVLTFAKKSEPATTVPDAPTGVTVATGDGVAKVSWTAPASDGGAPIKRYVVKASNGGGSCTTTATASSCRFTGLTDGKAYRFSVQAVNKVGRSEAATSSPVTLSFPAGGAGSVSLAVSAKAQCVSGAPQLAVHVLDKESVDVGLTVTTPLGGWKVGTLAAGAAQYSTLRALGTSLDAGTGKVVATKQVDGAQVRTVYQVAWDAVSCG